MNINEKRLVDEFIELVKIDSVTKDERQIANVLSEKLQGLSFKVIEDDAGKKIGGSTGNLIAVLEGNKNAPPLLFCAHMDRVQPGIGIKPQIQNGIIKSDGTTILAADDVAGIVAILEGIRIIQEQKLPHGRLEVLFTVAEEGGLFGAKNLDYEKLQAKAGYFLDAGGPVGTIITQAPAQKNINFKVHGKAAHAGVAPETGISALLVASHALTKMNLGRIDQETTANIGVVQGGEATNIIPDLVSLEGEARSTNDKKLEEQIKHMTEIMKATCAKYGVSADIDIQDSYGGFTLNESDQVVDLAIRAAQDIGLKPQIKSTGGGSDANIINKYGIPSVVLGMGYTDVHTTSETMPIKQLIAAAEYVISIVKNS